MSLGPLFDEDVQDLFSKIALMIDELKKFNIDSYFIAFKPESSPHRQHSYRELYVRRRLYGKLFY